LAAAVLAVASSAHAADLGMAPYRAAPTGPIPIFTWTGCYLGGQVGGGFGRKAARDPIGDNFAALGTTVIAHTDRPFAGGQVGCDWQFAPTWLIGVEGAAAWADIKGSTPETRWSNRRRCC